MSCPEAETQEPSTLLATGRRFDLHLHTNLSDGRYAPDEVLRRAAAARLDVIAITDHDLVAPVPHGTVEVDGRRLHVIAGAEVSGVHAGHEHHLLVYFPGALPDAFRDFTRAQCVDRVRRWHEAVANLKMTLPNPDAEAEAGARAVTRHHLARALVDAGYAANLRDAFARWLGDGRGYVPPLALSLVDAIRLARDCGGFTSWAHPTRQQVGMYLPELVKAGLQGVEGYRPYLTSADRGYFRKHAKTHKIVVTGGSDWHGWNDGELGLFWIERDDVQDFVTAMA